MTQSNFGTIDPATKSGTALATDLNGWRNAVHSMHSGNTRPSYVVAGMQWLDTSGATWLVKIYDGTDDIIIGVIDPTANTFKVPRTRQETIKTAAYTIVAIDDQYFTIVVNSATAVTISLPSLAGTKFEIQSIRNIGAGLVTIDPNGSETIEGAATLKLEQGAHAFVWPNSALNDWRADVTRSDGYYLRGTDNTDTTKKLITDLSSIATGTTRTLKVPDADVTISSYAATLLDDTTGAAIWATLGAAFSKGTSGYFKLPDGHIVQYGTGTNPGNDHTVTMPITFPTAFRAALVTPNGGSLAGQPNNTLAFPADIASTSALNVRPRYINSGTVGVATQNYYWLAIGY